MATPANVITRFEAPDYEAPQQRQEPESRPSPGAPRKEAEPDPRIEAMERELTEVRNSNRQLMDIVGRQTPAPKPAARQEAADEDIDWGETNDEADPDDDPDPATLVDEISKSGIQALAKRGFVRRSDVVRIAREESRKASVQAATQIVGRTRQQVTTESKIMSDYPDLGNPDSDLYKAVIPIVREATRLNPAAAKDPATLYMAARTASAEIKANSRRQAPERDDFDDEPEDREPVRRAPARAADRDRDEHIRAQSGDRDRSRSRIDAGEGEYQMDADAKNVAAALGLSDEEYTREAKKGYRPVGQRGRR